jgi:hypothetical protein
MNAATAPVLQGSFFGGRPRLPAIVSSNMPIAGAAARPISGPRPVPPQGPAIQRLASGDAYKLPTGLLNRGGPGGKPLPDPVRHKMESFFGAGLSEVRIHEGPLATALGARAITHGSDIHFAPGQYAPGTLQGQRLLGHEIAHVLQQRAGRVRNPFSSGVAIVLDHGMEAEAERMGARAALYQPSGRAGQAIASPTVQPKTRSARPAPESPGRPAGRVSAGQPVVQARFWEVTPAGKYIWHWGPVIKRWWRPSPNLDNGGQEMKGGYGVWLRKSAWDAHQRPAMAHAKVRNVPLQVGRRTAFFSSSPATHAVFKLSGKVYGLAGDFNAVGLAEDNSASSVFTWVAKTVYLAQDEARLFYDTAELTANRLTYTLFTQNCYTPVTAALAEVRRSTDDANVWDDLDELLKGLQPDNFGFGTVTSSDSSAYLSLVKKNV